MEKIETATVHDNVNSTPLLFYWMYHGCSNTGQYSVFNSRRILLENEPDYYSD